VLEVLVAFAEAVDEVVAAEAVLLKSHRSFL